MARVKSALILAILVVVLAYVLMGFVQQMLPLLIVAVVVFGVYKLVLGGRRY